MHLKWRGKVTLKLPFGIPSADTYRRLFERISPQALEKSFNAWLSSLVIDLGAQVIPSGLDYKLSSWLFAPVICRIRPPVR